jgi:NTE family protein
MRAFVLSGGASLGAVQVGMLRALDEADVHPDLVVGTSAGAVNAAWVAGHPGPGQIDGLADIWRGMRRRKVFPTRPLLGLRGFLGRADHLVPASGLRNLVKPHLTFEQLEDAKIPMHVVVTEAVSGREVVLSTGSALDAIVASASIPGVLPAVDIDGMLCVDGGVCNNTPISVAHSLGADEIWVLPSGHACSLANPPASALAMVLHAVTLLVHQRLVSDITKYEPIVDLRVAPPLCPLDVSPSDFSKSAILIDRAYDSTREWLATGRFDGAAAEMLEPHAH